MLLVTGLCLMPRLIHANEPESITLSDLTLTVAAEGSWTAQADVKVSLSPVLVEAVMRGVPLHFVSEFQLRKTRWWWLDKKIFSQSKTVRLSYHAVTQQFRVAVGGLHQMTYENLEEALSAAVSMRGWRIKEPLETPQGPGEVIDWGAPNLEARFRVRLDSAQLPKPLQINAITNRDWNLSSDWVEPKILMKNAGVLH
jgi:hypothetical protein